jgi:hypothetical protein
MIKFRDSLSLGLVKKGFQKKKDKNRMKILLAWEIGSGLGHIGRVLKIARACEDLGYQPVLALRHIEQTFPLWKKTAFPVIPAPFYQLSLMQGKIPFSARTHADILAKHNFHLLEILSPLLKSWRDIVHVTGVRAAICDYSPTALLALRSLLPVLAVGTGFSVPATQEGWFPVLNSRAHALLPQPQLLEGINKSLKQLALPLLTDFSSLYGETALVDCLPVLDAHQFFRSPAASVLPLENPFSLIKPAAQKPLLEAYLYLPADHPQLKPILELLYQKKWRCEVYIRGATPQLLKPLQKASLIKVHTTPPPLAEKIQQAKILIHHGGMATTQAGLCAGIAQFILPTDLEKSLTAATVIRLGCGLAATKNTPEQLLQEKLQQVQQEEKYTLAAQQQATVLSMAGKQWQGGMHSIEQWLQRI